MSANGEDRPVLRGDEGRLQRYRAVLRLPAAKSLLGAGLVGQMPTGMLTLCLVLAVSDATGSYAKAGLAVGAYSAAGGVAAPFWGRAADRLGARRVLSFTGPAFLLATVGAALVLRGGASPAAVLASVVAVGVTRPILSGTLQSAWPRLAVDRSLRKSAYALQTIEFEVVWVAGPVVVSAFLAALGRPDGALVALAVAGAFGLTGALLIAFAPAAATPAAPQSAHERASAPPLYTRPFLTLLASVALFEIAAGAGIITIAGFAERAGLPSASGLLIACWAAGSIVGGLWFGARRFETPLAGQYRRCLAALAAGYVLLSLLTTPWLLAIGLLVSGMALAPTFTVQWGLVADLAPPSGRTEAFTWFETIAAGGGAAGAALGSAVIVASDSASAGFGLAAGCVAGAAVLAAPGAIVLRRRRGLDRAPSHERTRAVAAAALDATEHPAGDAQT